MPSTLPLHGCVWRQTPALPRLAQLEARVERACGFRTVSFHTRRGDRNADGLRTQSSLGPPWRHFQTYMRTAGTGRMRSANVAHKHLWLRSFETDALAQWVLCQVYHGGSPGRGGEVLAAALALTYLSALSRSCAHSMVCHIVDFHRARLDALPCLCTLLGGRRSTEALVAHPVSASRAACARLLSARGLPATPVTGKCSKPWVPPSCSGRGLGG